MQGNTVEHSSEQ